MTISHALENSSLRAGSGAMALKRLILREAENNEKCSFTQCLLIRSLSRAFMIKIFVAVPFALRVS